MSTASGRGAKGRTGVGLTCDPRGAVVTHHLLCFRHHRTAEAIVAGTWLAATGVAWVVIETNGAVGTLNVRILVP